MTWLLCTDRILANFSLEPPGHNSVLEEGRHFTGEYFTSDVIFIEGMGSAVILV